MAINETIVTGRKFRKCIDAVNKTWQRISFWTKSSDVEFADGKNAETKLGAIDGITDSLVDTSSRMAASAKAVSTLNNNLTSKHYGDGTSSLVSVLNSVLTFDNIPYPQSCTFSVQSTEGYFICRATAWNNDWIGGIATPGIATQNKSFSFIRKASGGADTVINFISGGSGTLKVNFSFSTQMDNNDGQVGTGSGTLTVAMTNGAITSYNISGSGYGITIGGVKNASTCSVFGFRITSITWNPN